MLGKHKKKVCVATCYLIILTIIFQSIYINVHAEGMKITDKSYETNVTTEDSQTIKVMNPFDLTKPAVNAKVSIYGKVYNTDNSGYINANRQDIVSSGKLTVQYEDTNQNAAVFNTAISEPDADGVIQISRSIKDLKKLSVNCSGLASDFSGTESICSEDGIEICSLQISNVYKNVYLDPGNYVLKIEDSCMSLTDRYYISKSVNLSTDTNIVFDKSQLHKTTINYNDQRLFEIGFSFKNPTDKIPSDNVMYRSGVNTVYISPGLSVEASMDIDTCINMITNYQTSQNGSNMINIGKSFILTASGVDSMVPRDGQLHASFAVTDEYSNSNLSLYNSSQIYAVISQNGQDVETLQALAGTGYTDFTFNLNGSASGDAQVRFLLDMKDKGKVTSQNFSLNISTEDYTILRIKDPFGNAATNGKVCIGHMSPMDDSYIYSDSYSISKEGNVYIKSSDLSSNTKYKILIYGFTTSTNDCFVYTRDLDSSNKYTTYEALNSAKVNIKFTQNYPTTYGHFSIGINGSCISLRDFYNSNYNNDSENKWSNYNNFNVYADKGVYDFYLEANCKDENGTDCGSYNLMQKNVDTTKDSSVYFDKSNLCKLKVACDFSSPNLSSYNCMISPGDGYSFSNNPNGDTYVSKGEYDKITVECFDNQGRSFSFVKENYAVNDAETVIHYGKLPLSIVDSCAKIGQNTGIPSCAIVKDSINLCNSFIDSDGFSIRLEKNITAKFSQNGVVPDGGLITNVQWSVDVPNLKEGCYDLEAYSDTPFGRIETVNQKIYIASDSASIIQCPYDGNGNFNIYDGSAKIFTCNCNNFNKNIPVKQLDQSKQYTFNVDGYMPYNNAQLCTGSLYYDTSSMEWKLKYNDNNSGTINFINKPSNLSFSSMTYSITNSKGQTAYGSMQDSLNMKLSSDTYNVFIRGIDKDGSTYIFEKKLIVNANSNNKLDIDLSNLCKLNISNGFAKTPNSYSYEIVRKSNGLKSTLSDELKNGVVYVEKDSYTINADFSFSGVSNKITGIYNIDCNSSLANFTPGSKVSALVQADKVAYTSGDKISYTFTSVKDGETVLSGFSPSDFILSSIDVIHREKTLKTFKDIIPEYIKGECNLKINLINSLLGNVSGTLTVFINNSDSILDGDINLDGRVDIYDLVLLAKDYGMTKGTSTDWDGRCNLDNSDNANTIDIKDIAKAALNYNKKQ